MSAVLERDGRLQRTTFPRQPLPPTADRDTDLADAIARLPDKQKQVIAYHYLAGLPYADIATILGGSVDAARRAGADGIANLRRTYPHPSAQKGRTS
jgi:DNA-directed RNA polymerase specialized sigma24 family protein